MHVFKIEIVVSNNIFPHEIDLHITNEPEKGKTFLSIYKIEGDTLFICHALPGATRPTEFSSRQENKHILSVSKRR